MSTSFADETDYNDCNIPDEDRAPWSGDVRGYLIDTTIFGTQYFANGVGEACKNGWKTTVDVIPVE